MSTRKVTAVIARASVAALDVCRAGSQVALHLSTPGGVIIATMDEKEFVVKARGDRDHNNLPFRNLEQINNAGRAAPAPGEIVAEKAPVPKPGGKIL